MCKLRVFLTNDEGDTELQCDSCDMIFTVVWHRNAFYENVEYCPFCGEEIEGFIQMDDAE